MPVQAALATWRQRLIEHLTERGERWVADGKLVLRKKAILYGPNYPGRSAKGKRKA